MIRTVGAGFIAPIILVLGLGGSGCSVIGAGLGRSLDEARLFPVEAEAVSDSLSGRRIELHMADGRDYSGRLIQVTSAEGSLTLVIERKANQSLFGSTTAASDTVVVTPSDSLRVGGKPGNGMGLGLMLGVAIDVLVLNALSRKIEDSLVSD